jgi:hypothetical protein
MIKRHNARLLCATAILTLSGLAPTSAQQSHPNVVFILADNVGYGDLGPMGAESCEGLRRPALTSLPTKACG